jgi:hypothetical protein
LAGTYEFHSQSATLCEADLTHPRIGLQFHVLATQCRTQKGIRRGATHAFADGDLVAAESQRMLAIEVVGNR